MRKLIYLVAVTLDGFIAGPDGQVDFFGFDDDSAAAVLADWPETMPTHVRGPLGLEGAANRRVDTVVMGRGTYEPALAVGITSPYRHLEQFVFSRTLADLDPGVTFVGGDQDSAEFVRDLKRRDGLDIWLCGGGQLAAQLVDEIDELVLKVNPTVIGAGVPLFAGPFRPTPFRRTDTRTFETGVSIVTYERVEAA
ncbi:dihydrofolate reductase family protein [Dactylosporangium siamense]|uniref:Deaminase n=1 Tax=Dactylosporangium siamense TaxID=685454 RepID=A0A919U5X5_9ACTN|nr:dihydrofolate reductase family protein [Dactylosporangium siamense]GIG42837.1 deaminase [Dactylosporangium siamense]